MKNKYSCWGGQNTYKINPNKKKTLLMISISLFAIALISLGTYAIWNSELFTDTSSISTGQVKMSYTETNELSISNALPIKDEEGKVLPNYFDFSVMSYIKTNSDNNTSYKLNYNIILEPLTVDNPLSDSEIKVYLTKVESGVETVVVEPTTIDKLNQYVIKSQEEIFSNNKSEVTTSYRLRAWIDENVDSTKFNSTKYSYKFRVNVNNEAAPTKVTPALKFAKSKVGTDGLELVTHTIDDTLQVGSDFSTEYRYRGLDVNNYVTFNNEVWRIIGILPTEDTDGNVEYRYKIIRDTSLGTDRWNNCTIDSTGFCKYTEYTNAYANNWTTATLNTYLNEDYYNTLSTVSQSMIGTTKYYLGGYNDSNITSDVMWQYERKNDVNRSEYYLGTNPIIQNDSNKKIALMYASDYGYAASTNCKESLYNYDADTCNAANNWINKSQEESMLSPNSSYSVNFYIYKTGHVSPGYYSSETNNTMLHSFEYRPVLTLSSSVKITSGTGTSSDPYQLSIE